jgi:hypothetical protein
VLTTPQDRLACTTTLKTLELLVFPKCLARASVPYCKCGCPRRPFDDIEEYSDATVDHVFTQAASKVFQTLSPSCPAFTTLLFRAQEIDYDASADYLFGFIRSVRIDDSGDPIYEATAVEPHLLKHYEPCSEILDLDGGIVTTNAEKRAYHACPSAGHK